MRAKPMGRLVALTLEGRFNVLLWYFEDQTKFLLYDGSSLLRRNDLVQPVASGQDLMEELMQSAFLLAGEAIRRWIAPDVQCEYFHRVFRNGHVRPPVVCSLPG